MNPFAGIFLRASATDPNTHSTTYEVGFDDNRDPRTYTYAWSIVLDGSPCIVHQNDFFVQPTAPFTAVWFHPNCIHSLFPIERVQVVVSQGGRSITIIGPSLGPATIRPA